MERNQNSVRMLIITCLLIILVQASTENDSNFKMCGTWRHGKASRTLKYDLKTGCENIEISASESTLSIQGSITAKCTQSSSINLESNPLENQSQFCVFWDPLLDLLIVQVNGQKHTLCPPNGLQGSCCTHFSQEDQEDATLYGIANGSIHGDIITNDVKGNYTFRGDTIDCKNKLCDEASMKPRGANMIEEAVMKSSTTGQVNLLCAKIKVIEMDDGFTGLSFTLQAPRNVDANRTPTVYLPSCLNSGKSGRKSKVVCTYYKNKTLFQGGSSDAVLLDDIVGLSVGNETIKNLPEPVKIRFRHSTLPLNHSRRCVSWDTKEDIEVTWRYDGCTTVDINEGETECHCNHLTYFAILVQVEQKATVRHLKALTFITAVGCALSLVSCLVLFYWLCKRRGKKTQISLVHRGLVVAIFLLCLFFILTGTLGNVGNEIVCKITGSLLHYALLCTLCWMAMEVFHTFLLIRKVFNSTLPTWIFYLGGFGLPVLLVGILLSIGDIYGKRNIVPSDDVHNPYHMCWMLKNDKSQLAHYIINVGLLAVVVSSGAVMLFVVVREIRNRAEWKKIHVAFLSIWGLTCLFGTTWGLGFLDFGPLSEAILFLFCIINSLQGFFLMLRYYALDRMKNDDRSISDRSSSASSKQQMLQTH